MCSSIPSCRSSAGARVKTARIGRVYWAGSSAAALRLPIRCRWRRPQNGVPAAGGAGGQTVSVGAVNVNLTLTGDVTPEQAAEAGTGCGNRCRRCHQGTAPQRGRAVRHQPAGVEASMVCDPSRRPSPGAEHLVWPSSIQPGPDRAFIKRGRHRRPSPASDPMHVCSYRVSY